MLAWGHTNYALTWRALVNAPRERAVAVITALAMHISKHNHSPKQFGLVGQLVSSRREFLLRKSLDCPETLQDECVWQCESLERVLFSEYLRLKHLKEFGTSEMSRILNKCLFISIHLKTARKCFWTAVNRFCRRCWSTLTVRTSVICKFSQITHTVLFGSD